MFFYQERNNGKYSSFFTLILSRFAFQSAMKAAFSKFIIIRLKNGKITAEVDTTQCDPLIYDPAWDNPVVKVNDVNYDPDDEEECEDLEDMTEEQLEELLNVPL
ncbi:putative DNA repair protein RAD52-like [Homarus americanus]|uniref:Putative DNA repair protein RAD52-like n=1 Tax=Homarus americanus TaxID=6706 RepID=A0A8J5MSC8_HOMAM|nr:putative DNA repair protein RAD52-like [Homarus americanus]